ncbi:hypothetical protein [Nostoc sp. CHAB 5715]|uniref:hypothetical protein n=1 Tax=Nostoc sp. CHAB 5715 TaxID=2780400 RepID=UPI001E568363|nr:hypothetical protein [Nostoc sp. CHAB 5715]MCC5623258.1 hypothetical protein [Nostoc sp. CHAB 5715]
MSKQPTNGTQKKNPRKSGSHQCNGDNSNNRVGSVQAESRQHENDSIGLDQGDSYRNRSDPGKRHESGRWGGKQTSVGKILKRLKIIEESYNSDVGSYQERLESLLEESKDKQKQFAQEVRLLEAEILDLISEESPSNEDPRLETNENSE